MSRLKRDLLRARAVRTRIRRFPRPYPLRETVELISTKPLYTWGIVLSSHDPSPRVRDYVTCSQQNRDEATSSPFFFAKLEQCLRARNTHCVSQYAAINHLSCRAGYDTTSRHVEARGARELIGIDTQDQRDFLAEIYTKGPFYVLHASGASGSRFSSADSNGAVVRTSATPARSLRFEWNVVDVDNGNWTCSCVDASWYIDICIYLILIR